MPWLSLVSKLEQPQIEPGLWLRLLMEPGKQRAGIPAIPQTGCTRDTHEIL